MDDAQLFRTHCNAVYRVFANKLHDRADVDDLVQQTFTRFFGVDRARMEQPVRYLLRIAHNLLREYWRKRATRGQAEDISECAIADLAPGASTLMGRSEAEQLMLDGLRTLRLNEQAALELHYWGGFRYREIADVLDLPQGTVASLIASAKRRLRQHIEARHQGTTDDDVEAQMTSAMAGHLNPAPGRGDV